MQVYRNNIPHILLPDTKEITYQRALMGEHKVFVNSLDVPEALDLQVGDYIQHNGVRFVINTVPNYHKVEHTQQHRYDIIFESPLYRLYDKLFMFEGEEEFPFFGDAYEHLQLIVAQINQIDTGWAIGEVTEVDAKHTNFDSVSCRVALTQIAEVFGLEWSVENKVINLRRQIGQDRPITLQYGKGRGLYALSRNYVQEKNVITRVFGRGGGRNLPEGYQWTNLRLPAPKEGNIDVYGVKEGIYRNEDIFPTRTGTVTSVGALDADIDTITLVDTSLDFDINDHLAAGITAKVEFQDGELSGYEFEISAYNHSNKTITYIRVEDTATGQIMPNENFLAQPGDTYKLFDIYLPQSYIDAAIARLDEETEAHKELYKWPQVAYDLSIDVLHYKKNGYELEPGDRIRVIDTDIFLDANIRVVSISHPLAFPDHLWKDMSFEIEIANFVPYTVQERIMTEAKVTQRQVRSTTKAVIETEKKVERNTETVAQIVEEGLNYKVKHVAESATLEKKDVYISCYNGFSATLLFEPNPKTGKAYYIRSMTTAQVIYNGNGNAIHNDGPISGDFAPVDVNIGDLSVFVFDGNYWNFNRWVRQG